MSTAAQEIEHARHLLNSSAWVDRAWGLYLAGRLHTDDLDPLLIDQFRQAEVFRNAPPGTDDHAFLLVLFDAGIEAGITVPEPLLEPFEKDWPDPVLILLARNNESEA